MNTLNWREKATHVEYCLIRELETVTVAGKRLGLSAAALAGAQYTMDYAKSDICLRAARPVLYWQPGTTWLDVVRPGQPSDESISEAAAHAAVTDTFGPDFDFDPDGDGETWGPDDRIVLTPGVTDEDVNRALADIDDEAS